MKDSLLDPPMEIHQAKSGHITFHSTKENFIPVLTPSGEEILLDTGNLDQTGITAFTETGHVNPPDPGPGPSASALRANGNVAAFTETGHVNPPDPGPGPSASALRADGNVTAFTETGHVNPPDPGPGPSASALRADGNVAAFTETGHVNPPDPGPGPSSSALRAAIGEKALTVNEILELAKTEDLTAIGFYIQNTTQETSNQFAIQVISKKGAILFQTPISKTNSLDHGIILSLDSEATETASEFTKGETFFRIVTQTIQEQKHIGSAHVVKRIQ